jgi:hypothetical protein
MWWIPGPAWGGEGGKGKEWGNGYVGVEGLRLVLVNVERIGSLVGGRLLVI